MGLTGEEVFFFFIVAAIGGLTLPLYTLCVVHTNDYLTPIQMVAASGTLVLLSSVGATIGSPLTAIVIDNLGSQSFYGTISVLLIIVATFTLWRVTQRFDVRAEEQREFVVMPATPLSASLTPSVELDEIEEATKVEKDEIISSFEDLAANIENSNGSDSS